MRVAFIGLGAMGGGMAANQVKAGRSVLAYDLSQDALDRAARGCEKAGSVAEAVKGAEWSSPCCPPAPQVRRSMREADLPERPPRARC